MQSAAMMRAALALFLLFVTPAWAAEWTYTDGNGKIVTLPGPPERIVAHISAAAALIPLGIRPVAVFTDGPPSVNPALDDLDLTGITVIESEWSAPNLEQLLTLAPDLLITEWGPRENFYRGAFGNPDIIGRVETIAPVAGPAAAGSILTLIEDYENLAERLGAEPDSKADRAAFDAALARFKSAIARKPGLTVMAVSPSNSAMFVADPAEFGELADFQSWGLDLVIPERDADSSYQSLSWENANLYPADLILVDDRWGRQSLDALAYQPLAQRLPALRAGQVGAWPAGWIRSYGAYAEQLDRLTETIEAINPDVVD